METAKIVNLFNGMNSVYFINFIFFLCKLSYLVFRNRRRRFDAIKVSRYKEGKPGDRESTRLTNIPNSILRDLSLTPMFALN